MSETVRRMSPLAHLFAEGTPSTGAAVGVTLTERPFLVHLDLWGDPSDRAFLDAARGAVGVALPLEPNTVARGPETAALWLGPDEWLILAPPDGGGLESTIERALEGRRHAVVDVSGGQTVIGLSGGRAPDVLAKGCTLDLHPRAFGPGRCAQTLVAKANATIWQTGDGPSYDLIVRRSFAEYLAFWLIDASREYGLTIIPPPI